MEIRYFKYCHHEYVARINPLEARSCTMWARSLKTSWKDNYKQEAVYLGKFVSGNIEPNENLHDTHRYDYSIRQGSKRMYKAVCDRFVSQVESVYTGFMAEKREKGQPANHKAIRIVATLIARNPKLSSGELANLMAKKLKRKRVDPKQAWRWKNMAIKIMAVIR